MVSDNENFNRILFGVLITSILGLLASLCIQAFNVELGTILILICASITFICISFRVLQSDWVLTGAAILVAGVGLLLAAVGYMFVM